LHGSGGSTAIFVGFLFRAMPLYDEAGRLVKWYGQTTDIDIDDQKRAEALLAQRSVCSR